MNRESLNRYYRKPTYKKFSQLGYPVRGNHLPVCKIAKLRDNAVIPKKMSVGAAGYDLYASHFITETLITDDKPPMSMTLKPGDTVKIGTGFACMIPTGYEIQIRSRSGMAINKNLVVINSPGTIDSDYRGEIVVAIKNLSDVDQTIAVGDRVAQMVFNKLPSIIIKEVDQSELTETERGAGGFGSTGTK